MSESLAPAVRQTATLHLRVSPEEESIFSRVLATRPDIQAILYQTPEEIIRPRIVGKNKQGREVTAAYVPHQYAREILDALFGPGNWFVRLKNVSWAPLKDGELDVLVEGQIFCVHPARQEGFSLPPGEQLAYGGATVKKGLTRAVTIKAAVSRLIVDVLRSIGFFRDVYSRPLDESPQMREIVSPETHEKELQRRMAAILKAIHPLEAEARRLIITYITDDETRCSQGRPAWNVTERCTQPWDGQLKTAWLVMTPIERYITIKHFEKLLRQNEEVEQ